MLSRSTQFVGILNITPDSFSDGVRFKPFGGSEEVLEVARAMVEDGATILDIGGESTGPGSVDVSVEKELARVLPVLRALVRALPGVKLSIDTWKSDVAEAALKEGAAMINDVTAGRADPRIFELVARYQVPMVLMYSKQNTPRTDREMLHYDDVIKTIKVFLEERTEAARAAGVRNIIVDPGMGAFVSGQASYSYEIIDRIEEFYDLNYPLWVGTSRKSFLGEDRLGMTLWTTLQLQGKVDYLRVHDVCENMTLSV